jgi:hypothetical protein
VIARYVEHTQISGMVIALLRVMGEEKVRPLADNETGRPISPPAEPRRGEGRY